MEKETASEETRWKREMTDTVFEAVVRITSLGLLRARADFSEGLRDWTQLLAKCLPRPDPSVNKHATVKPMQYS